MTRRFVNMVVAALAVLVLTPAVARAQSAITGVVKDTSGAVLPGVTVEAASDALIEKVKSVVSDGNGVYRITDLRPGTYSVTFSLPGFQTLKRDGLALPSEFTMTINGDMKVGALEETITVSGDAPVVDVSTAVHTQVLNREAIDAIPTGRTIQGLGQLVVGVSLSLPDTGGARAMQQTYMSAHGLSAANNTVMVDGMIVNGLQADGAVQSYFNDAMNQEVSYQTSGINAETSAGGVRLNMIPREGGNTFAGTFAAAYRPGAWQSDNLTERHLAYGLNNGTHTDRIIDFTGTEGGPIMKDKLWFFVSARYFSVNNFIANTFTDAGDQGIDDQFIKSALVRLTWQITPKLKLGAYHDEIDKFRGHDMQSGWDPETAATVWTSPAYHTNQGKITYTATSRLLFEGGFSSNLEYYTNQPLPGLDKYGTPEQFTTVAKYDDGAGAAAGGMIATCASFTTCTPHTTQSPARYNWQAAASYVTGSHNIKTGIQYQRGTFYHSQKTNADLQQMYRTTNSALGAFGTPNSVTVLNTSGQQYGEKLDYDIAIFGQDSWTLKRLTMNMGLRWEAMESSVIGGTQPANRWVPEVVFPDVKGLPKWKDIAPRFSTVYDLFGDSKTALKYSVNRYNISRTTGIAENYSGQRLSRVNLPWTDLNNDGLAQGFVTWNGTTRTNCTFNTPGCEINFANLAANYGLVSENVFGNYDRAWDLEHAVEIQHELFPRLSVTGSWFHGDFHDLSSTINETLRYDGDPTQNPNYRPFTVFNPLTGEQITAYGRCPTTAASAAAAGNPCGTTIPSTVVKNVDFTDNSDLRKLSYNAYNLEFRARLGRGSQIFGGVAFERQLATDCARAADDPNKLRFCDDRENDIPFAKQLKLAGNYPLPYGVQLSASFQSNPGPTGVGTPSQTVPSTPAQPSATRTMIVVPGASGSATASKYPSTCPAPCPAGQQIALNTQFSQTSQTIYLAPPSGTFVERLNQFDIKIARTFKYNRVTFMPQLEIFNLLNSDAVVTYVTTNTLGGANYLKPNSLMQPRLIGIGGQIKW